MADPLTIAAVASIAVSAGTQVFQGVRANQFAKEEAETQKELGRIEADRIRREGARLRASQRVGFAAGGVDVSFGTPLDVLSETAREVELSALRQGVLRKNEAKSLEFQGGQSLLSGLSGAATTILGGTSTLKNQGSVPKSTKKPKFPSALGGGRPPVFP